MEVRREYIHWWLSEIFLCEFLLCLVKIIITFFFCLATDKKEVLLFQQGEQRYLFHPCFKGALETSSLYYLHIKAVTYVLPLLPYA